MNINPYDTKYKGERGWEGNVTLEHMRDEWVPNEVSLFLYDINASSLLMLRRRMKTWMLVKIFLHNLFTKYSIIRTRMRMWMRRRRVIK